MTNFAAILLSVLVGASVAYAEEYEQLADTMAYYGYTWEAEKVHTDDGFILTTFHVTGSVEGGPFTPTQGPVLI